MLGKGHLGAAVCRGLVMQAKVLGLEWGGGVAVQSSGREWKIAELRREVAEELYATVTAPKGRNSDSSICKGGLLGSGGIEGMHPWVH